MKGSIQRRLAVAALVGITTFAVQGTTRAQVLLTDDPSPSVSDPNAPAALP